MNIRSWRSIHFNVSFANICAFSCTDVNASRTWKSPKLVQEPFFKSVQVESHRFDWFHKHKKGASWHFKFTWQVAPGVKRVSICMGVRIWTVGILYAIDLRKINPSSRQGHFLLQGTALLWPTIVWPCDAVPQIKFMPFLHRFFLGGIWSPLAF